MRRALAALVTSVLGCEAPADTCTAPVVKLRNPENLHCDWKFAPSPTCPVGALPSWAPCEEPCIAVAGEAACLQTAGCRPTYDECILSGDPCFGGDAYLACFGLDQAGPAPGPCEGLDAQDCSSREDCAAWFVRGPQCPPGQDPDDGPDRPPGPGPAPVPDGEGCFLSFAACRAKPTTPVTDT